MSDSTPPDPDIEELRERVAALEAATAALREYGEDNDVPAVERNAARIEGTVSVIKRNVPEKPDGE